MGKGLELGDKGWKLNSEIDKSKPGMDDQRIVLSLEIPIRHELGARHKLPTYVDSHKYLHQTSSSVVTSFVMIISLEE